MDARSTRIGRLAIGEDGAMPLRLLGLTALFTSILVFGGAVTQVATAAVGDSIPFRGIEAEGEGAAAWNADGTGPEVANTGHLTSWTNCLQVAYYHLTSRDYGNLDAASVAGIHGLSPFVPVDSFPQLAATLAANGLDAGDLKMSWGLQTLGQDVQGQDWTYDEVTHVETRHYTGGEFTLKLHVQAGQPPEDMVGGPMPTTTLTIAYNELSAPPIENCADDQISGVTGVGVATERSAGSSAATQAVTVALLNDLGGNGIRFVFDSLQPAGQEEFSLNGRTGAYFEAQTGRIEVMSTPLEEQCSCIVGIFEADSTHDWRLSWTGASLPSGEPVRLKVVASSVNSAESGSIIVNITDETGPKSVEMVHPATGDAVGYIELDISVGVVYPFTVQYTGDAHHYKVGASHDDLSLMQDSIRYLEGVPQLWSIMAGANETVSLQITTESGGLNPDQASLVELVVVDASTRAVVHGPDSRTLSLDTPEIFTSPTGPSLAIWR